MIENQKPIPVEIVSEKEESEVEELPKTPALTDKRASVTSMMSVSVARLNKHDPFLEDLKQRIEALENRAEANESKIETNEGILKEHEG